MRGTLQVHTVVVTEVIVGDNDEILSTVTDSWIDHDTTHARFTDGQVYDNGVANVNGRWRDDVPDEVIGLATDSLEALLKGDAR